MSEECTHDCSTCTANCSSKNKESLLVPANSLSNVKNVIAVMSGKGGVGKSMVTSLLAVLLQRQGLKVGILDADITGPSIPQAFGLHNTQIYGDDNGMIPAKTTTGIDIMSLNLMIGEDETRPVIWRGSLIAGTVQQFWKDTIWDCDVLLVDCPPGTGDVPLTVFQSLPLNGAIIVTSPQELVEMIVSKAINMADMMNIPVLGLVENMSYVKCPDCGKEIHIFGESHIAELAEKFGTKLLGRIPMDAKLSKCIDKGAVELTDADYLDGAVEELLKALKLGDKA